ncbi:MAG: exosortase/archaeosortase family protein [Gemmataceae bacterium]
MTTTANTRTDSPWLGSLLAFGALLAAVIWSYAPELADMMAKWSSDPQYSHAYLVPAFSLYLLWRYCPTSTAAFRPSWWGLLLMALGVALRLVGVVVFFDWLVAASLLPLLAGAVLLVAGPAALRWSWRSIGFLVFMVPLPFRVETALSHPLQRMATIASTFVLQTLGRPAFSEGNVIVINDMRLGVEEACNGLGMLMLFFAMATAVAMLIERPWWEKVVVVVSAIPIAVGVNVIRIIATSILYETAGKYWGDKVFHDFAGWLMMPMALAALGLELKFLSHLFIEVKAPERGPLRMNVPTGRKAPVVPAVR